MDRDKVIDKIAKLQSHVEGTSIEAEALAFGAAAARLMLEHDIEDADIEAHKRAGTVRKEEPIVKDALDLRAMGIFSSGKRNAALEDLAMFVGRAHLCKTLIRPGSNWIGLVGTASHIAVAQLVIGTMWRSLNKMAVAGLRTAKREGADISNYTRSFRQAFVWRLQARYSEERQAVVAEHTMQTCVVAEHSTALVVINRELERAGDYISKHYKGRARSIGNSGGSNRRGASDGRSAANNVPLRSNAVTTGGSRGQLGA